MSNDIERLEKTYGLINSPAELAIETEKYHLAGGQSDTVPTDPALVAELTADIMENCHAAMRGRAMCCS